jgi:hypothetical protein
MSRKGKSERRRGTARRGGLWLWREFQWDDDRRFRRYGVAERHQEYGMCDFIFWQGRRGRAGGVQAPAHAKKRAQCNREVSPVWEALETGPRYCISSIEIRSEAVASDEIGNVGSSGISYD